MTDLPAMSYNLAISGEPTGGAEMLKFTMYVDHNHDGSAEVIYPKIHEEHEVPSSHEGRMEWIRNSCENLLERIKEREQLLSRY